MEIINKFKPFRLSPLTREVEGYMKKLNEGEVAKYEQLSIILRMNCRPNRKGYPYVMSALRRIEKKGHNFANIPNIGYRKLNPNETIHDNNRRFVNTRKQIQRTLNRNNAVDHKRLGTSEFHEWRAATVFGRLATRILSGRTKRKMIDKIQKKPEVDFKELSEVYQRNKT